MKYPRTLHFPSSPGGTRDDRRHSSLETFAGRRLVFTEKVDGSNVCLERKQCFARSHGHAPTHPSFDAFKALHAEVRHFIPDHLQIFGEWLYAKHSIHYTELDAYLQIFAVHDQHAGEWLSWPSVGEWAECLGLMRVPLVALYQSMTEPELELNIGRISENWKVSRFGGECEGLVGRWFDSFTDAEFEQAVGKWVRKGHVQSDEHWMHQEIVRNQLGGS